MKIRTVLDGNAFYEIDEECMERENHRTGWERNRQAGRQTDRNVKEDRQVQRQKENRQYMK